MGQMKMIFFGMPLFSNAPTCSFSHGLCFFHPQSPNMDKPDNHGRTPASHAFLDIFGRSQVLQRSRPDLEELKTWATFLRSHGGGSMLAIDARKAAWKLQGEDFSGFFPWNRNETAIRHLGNVGHRYFFFLAALWNRSSSQVGLEEVGRVLPPLGGNMDPIQERSLQSAAQVQIWMMMKRRVAGWWFGKWISIEFHV